jgi:hypothetical protein
LEREAEVTYAEPVFKGGIMKPVSVALMVCLFTLTPVVAHEPGRDMATIRLGKGKVTIDYGTPKIRGRKLDDMIKPGLPWRMGMNEATTMVTTVALDFHGKKLPPGKYTLFARPDEKKNWTLLISSGSANKLDPATVVVDSPLQFKKEEAPLEVLKITLGKASDGASLTIAWGTYRLRTVFEAAA